ncbi:MAG: thiamine pyrophosphate-binding protein, partial [Pseudomonadota bacterium]|nr:thiamine pyrophosphate-binding protein [Pseudomonadota bacterium]
MRVADYVMQRLHDENCNHVFTVTGRGILYLTDSLAKNTNIESVSVHHEQSASYAAMSYSQYNGNIGAALVSTGCGATNAITGLLCAWQDDIPCIFISGQNKLAETTTFTKLQIRTYGQQEADIVSLVKPITKYATMLVDHKDVAYEIDKALYLAKSGRKGPVWLDIPLDIQNMRIDPDNLKRFSVEERFYGSDRSNLEDVYYTLSVMRKSKRPIVLVGSGVRTSGSIEILHSFLSKHNLPCVFSSSATDILDPEKVLSIGCVGAMASNRAANFAIQNSDMVLVLGNRLSTMVTGECVDKFARGAKIIAVDIDKYEH